MVADALLVVHFLIAAFIVAGLVLVWLGAALGWRWVRNPWFRYLHLGAIGFVAAEALLGVACPLCNGMGVVPRGVHDHYVPLLSHLNLRHCEGCGEELSLPRDPGDLAPEDRTRMEQFFHGGPLFCDGCYVRAPSCDDCGWHIPAERAAEHHREAHPHCQDHPN